jgi:hypothetical protein
MGYIGSKKFENWLKDQKPAVAQKVQPIIMKCKANVVPKGGNPSADVEMKEEPAKTSPNKIAAKPKTVPGKTPARPETAKPKEATAAPTSSIASKRPATAVPQKPQSKDAGGESLNIKSGNKN